MTMETDMIEAERRAKLISEVMEGASALEAYMSCVVYLSALFARYVQSEEL